MKRATVLTTFQLATYDPVDVQGAKAENLPVETISEAATPSVAHTNLDALPTASSFPARTEAGGFVAKHKTLIALLVVLVVVTVIAVPCGVIISRQKSSTTTTVAMATASTTISPCASNPCWSNSNCSVTNSTPYYQCNCINGYSGTNCTTSPCANSTSVCGSYGTCLLTPGTYPYYNCTCLNGTCPTNPCSTHPCGSYGSCLLTPTASPYYNCTCTSGYTGSTCATDPCTAMAPCGTYGTCQLTPATWPYYNCTCVSGYSGSNCSKDICTAYHPCGIYGSCTVTPSSAPYYSCTCTSGYSGTNCTIDPCNAGSCVNYNNCTLTPTVSPYYQCSCTSGGNSSAGSCLASPCGSFGNATSAGISSWSMTNPCSATTNTGYFLVSFSYYAQNSSETLTIASVNVPAYIYIDDISVRDVSTGTELLCNGGFENGTCVCWTGTCPLSTSPCRTGNYCINNGLTYLTSFSQTFNAIVGDLLQISLYTYWTGSGSGVTLDVTLQP